VLIVVVVDTSHVVMMLVVRHVLVRISFHISGIICERCDRICIARIVIISLFFLFLVPLSRSQSLPFTSSPRLIMIVLFFSQQGNPPGSSGYGYYTSGYQGKRF
jgi:hypothetical protein